MTITRRERVRQMTLDEIKSLSWGIIAEKGVEQLTINGIARRMGMTPPAFYRYYKNRDDLVRTLVTEAYASFRAALETARDKIPAREPVLRIYRVYEAYRDWAVETPNMFGLFAGRRVYGFDPQDPRVTDEAHKVYLIFIELYRTAWNLGQIELQETAPPRPGPYTDRLKKIQKNWFPGIPLELIHQGISGACLVHGMISLEISGRFREILGEGRNFYDCQIREIMDRQGMDVSQIDPRA